MTRFVQLSIKWHRIRGKNTCAWKQKRPSIAGMWYNQKALECFLSLCIWVRTLLGDSSKNGSTPTQPEAPQHEPTPNPLSTLTANTCTNTHQLANTHQTNQDLPAPTNTTNTQLTHRHTQTPTTTHEHSSTSTNTHQHPATPSTPPTAINSQQPPIPTNTYHTNTHQHPPHTCTNTINTQQHPPNITNSISRWAQHIAVARSTRGLHFSCRTLKNCGRRSKNARPKWRKIRHSTEALVSETFHHRRTKKEMMPGRCKQQMGLFQRFTTIDLPDGERESS